MYTTTKSSRLWNYVLPWIVILLLSLVLFIVAATIVLSLIAVFLPTRNVNVASTSSGPQQITIQLSSDSSLATGPINETEQTSLENEMQNVLSTNDDTGDYADVQVNNAVGINSAKRKRRQESGTATYVIVTFELFFKPHCAWHRCRIRVLANARVLFAQLRPKLSSTSTSSGDEVTGDIELISQYWANLRPYADNPDDYFGVTDTGLPDGCQIEQSFMLHRHGGRYPSTGDLQEIDIVTAKLRNTNGTYTGLMSFFNTWTNQLGSELLLPEGTRMAYQSGVDFWKKYGLILYNDRPGQNYYNATGQIMPQVRCNTIQRVTDTAVAWADGFFTLYNQTDKYTLLKIPAAPGLNNTLASFYSCKNFLNGALGTAGASNALYYPIGNYLSNTVIRLSQYMPSDINLTIFDVFILQLLCPYEYTVFGSSDFCSLFTINEWQGFSYTYDIWLYNSYSFGSPAGRALGLGVLQELLARLQNETIPLSNSSVNTAFDGNTDPFPLGQKFYADFTHDFMIMGFLTAMSLDYFRGELSPNAYPPPEDRHFKTTNIVPYAARIITEKIGCNSANPTANNFIRTQYTATQYGYSAQNATNKFIRMRLNSGILPLDTIRGGFCAGRTDGLCPLENFLASQANATAEANYGEVCFGNFTYNASLFNDDGNYFP